MIAEDRSLNNNNQDYEHSFLSQMSIKFKSCHTIHSWRDVAGDNGVEGVSPYVAQHLVKYELCPSRDRKGSCSEGGQYVADIRDFIPDYIEARREAQEAQCENVENNCRCNYYNGDDQRCLNNCFRDAGLEFCAEEENDFKIEDYMDCVQADFGGNYYNSFYIGPVCSSDGKGIHMQIFTDSACTVAAAENTYERFHYGSPLPYSQKSMADSTPVSCANNDGNNNNNNNNNNKYSYYKWKNGYYKNANYYQEPSELCEDLYDRSAKCEKNLKYKNDYSHDEGACEYIEKVLPALERVYKNNGGAGSMVMLLAVIFGITSFIGCIAASYFRREVDRISDVLADAGKKGSYANMN